MKHGNKIYLIPTYQSSPMPYLDSISSDENWRILVRKLAKLNVKKIIIGGTYLWMNSRQTGSKNQQQLKGCVGTAIEVLENNFKIEISNLAHPNSRKDYILPDKEVMT